jgi:hypothetical protein
MATANIGKAYIQIVPSMNDFQNQVQKGLGSAGEAGAKTFTNKFSA